MRSLIIVLVVLMVACCSDTIVNVPVSGTTVPGGSGMPPQRVYTEYQLCGVTIRFALENGRGVEIQFANPNAATMIAKVFNEKTGALIGQNCVWPRSTDVSAASFAPGDRFRIVVLQGQGQIISRLCTEVLNSLLHQFAQCGEAIFNFQ